MSKTSANCCNTCGKYTLDYMDEIGWIHLDTNGLTISGGRKADKTFSALRYIQEIKARADYDTVDFCGFECFINYLYFKADLFNGAHKTYDDFIIKQPKAVQDMYKKIKFKMGKENATGKRKHD